jgi:hypothetical protein
MSRFSLPEEHTENRETRETEIYRTGITRSVVQCTGTHQTTSKRAGITPYWWVRLHRQDPLNRRVALNPRVAICRRLAMYRYVTVFSFICVMLFVQCSPEKTPSSLDFEVLLEVNGVERTVYDFESTYVEHLIKTGRNDSQEERSAHLNKMIDDILLAESAVQKGLTSHPTYQSALQHEERKSMIDTYFVDRMEEVIAPLTDEEIRLAYAKRQRKAYIRQLYSRDPEELESAYEELETGEDFVDVANRFYETSSYDSLAGYLGPVSYFGIDDAVAEAAYSTPQGEYTKPVRSRLGYHIIYVEYIEFPALLAEDEYQYRKQGVASQLRLRRQRTESGDYIFELMSGLSVETNRQNILALQDAIANLEGDRILEEPQLAEETETIWTDERVKQLEASMDRGLVLATYVLDGQPREFTFGEYINWLPYLSFQESKVRLGASVGRGMRNQVLYELATDKQYDADARVKKKIEKRGTQILSDLNQYEITMAAIRDTGRVDVPESFRSRLISSREVLLKAAYWKIPAENLQEAKQIKEVIGAGTDPAGYPGYRQVAFATIDPNEADYNLVMKAIEKTPLVGYSADEGWLVIRVDEREITEIATTTNTDDLERSFKVYDSIRAEIDSLRAEAEIVINDELFQEMYRVWTPRK